MSEESTAKADSDSDRIEIVGSPDDAKEQARDGIRGWVGRAGQATRKGARTTAPWAALATICAATVAPVAGPALGLTSLYEVAIGQLMGGLGGNLMADLLMDAASRVKGVPSEDEWRKEIAELLTEALAAPEEKSGALRQEVSQLLTNVDSISVAVRASAANASDVGERLLAALGDLGELGEDFVELQVRTLTSLNRFQDELASRSAAQRQQIDLTQTSLTGLTVQVRDLIARLPRSKSGRGAAEPWVTRHDECPYPGLVSFDATQAAFFFGRKKPVTAVLTTLAELAQVPTVPLFLIGVSGVGKSSLLQAGVIPALQAGELPGSAEWRVVSLTPTGRPLAVLSGAVTKEPADAFVLLDRLRRRPEDFGAIASQGRRGDGGLLIVVDQFEELFTGGSSETDRRAFVTALLNAAPAVVVIAVRADFYARCMELPDLARVLSDRQVLVGPMTAEDLHEVVLRPADRVGLKVQPALLQILMSDLKVTAEGYEPGSLPLLAQALQATWQKREDGVLTVAGYREAGSIAGAIKKKADGVFNSLDPDGQLELRRMLLRGIAVTGGEASRRPIPRAGLPAEPLAKMVAERLMTAAEDTVQITHEALLTAWPMLRDWVAEERRDLELRERLRDAAAYWDEQQKESASLYRGARLEATREWLSTRPDLTPTERAFLVASDAESRQELQTERRRSLRLRRMAAALVVLLVVALGAGGLAWRTARRANLRELIASSQRYAVESASAAATDPRRAMLLAALAWDTNHTSQARSALLSAQMLNHAGLLNDPGAKSVVAVSRDGRLVATGGFEGRVTVWDVRTHRLLAKLAGLDLRQVRSLQFSPDGSMLAATGLAQIPGALRVWSVPAGRRLDLPATGGWGEAVWGSDHALISFGYDGTPPNQTRGLLIQDVKVRASVRRVPLPPGALPYHLAISPDGQRVAVGRVEGSVTLMRLRDGHVLRTFPALAGEAGKSVAVVAYAPDGRLAVAGSRDGRVTLWDGLTGAHLSDLPVDSDRSNTASLAFSRDGSQLYALGGSSNPFVWDFAEGVWQPQSVGSTGVGDRGVLTSVATSGDGHLVALAGDRPTLLTRRAVHWQRYAETGAFMGLAVSNDGRELAAGGAGGRGTVWVSDLATGSYRAAVPNAGAVRKVTYSREGALAAVSDDGRLWLTSAGATTRSIDLGQRLSSGLAFNPEGSLLAATVTPDPRRSGGVASNTSEVRVWDARTLRQVASAPLTLVPGSVAFSPDGDRLAVVGSWDSGNLHSYVLLWDVAGLRRGQTQPQRAIDIGSGSVGDAVFSPDSKTLAAAAGDRVRLLDPASGQLIRTVANNASTIRSVRFSFDGKTLATTSTDEAAIRLWSVADGASVATLTGHAGSVNEIEFGPTSPTLYSAGADSTIGVWNLDPAVVLGSICVDLSGDLAAGDWRGLGVDPKKSPCS